ncbi:MAG: ABC transporter ATP-binding protein [Rhodospirillales bacterium]
MSELRLQAVSHRYGDRLAVDRVDLTVEEGELLCLLGPSGCGKTTILRLAAGLEPLQQGSIEIAAGLVAGEGVDLPPEERSVGLVFQDFALFPHLNVAENVAFGLRGRSAEERRRRSHELLAQVRLADYAKAYPHTLSGGQQQRIALARALAPAPRVMLLDEPFSGLDASLRREVRDETLHVLKQAGIACVMVTHDPEEAMFMADRIALMREGVVVQEGPPDRLYAAPADHFVAGFFGEVNTLPGQVRGGAVVTPLGSLPAPELAEGSPVEVLVRSEGLLLGALAVTGSRRPLTTAKVEAARLLGRSSLVHLSLESEPEQPDLHLHARVEGRFLPQAGSRVPVTFDPDLVFLFSHK